MTCMNEMYQILLLSRISYREVKRWGAQAEHDVEAQRSSKCSQRFADRFADPSLLPAISIVTHFPLIFPFLFPLLFPLSTLPFKSTLDVFKLSH